MGPCDCDRPCACSLRDGCGISVTGNGAEVNPFIVGVKTSPVPNNTLECRTDGLYVPPSSAIINVDDSSTIDFNLVGTGTPNDPYTITGDVIADSNQSASVSGAGLGVRLSSDPGNTVVRGSDGGLYSPVTSGAGICLSDDPCNGLEQDGNGCLNYKDHTSLGFQNAFLFPGGAFGGAGYNTISECISIVNPSSCRQMEVFVNTVAKLNISYRDTEGWTANFVRFGDETSSSLESTTPIGQSGIAITRIATASQASTITLDPSETISTCGSISVVANGGYVDGSVISSMLEVVVSGRTI